MANENETLRDEVLAVLSDAPQGLAAIYAACETAEDQKQVANILFRLRQSGLVTSAGRGLYVRGTVEKRAMVPRPKRAQVAPKARAVRPSATAEAIVRKLVADTQSALDAYLLSIGDPAILTPLREACDQARAALAHIEGEAV
jgi:hypothetical protein